MTGLLDIEIRRLPGGWRLVIREDGRLVHRSPKSDKQRVETWARAEINNREAREVHWHEGKKKAAPTTGAANHTRRNGR
jgi:hypothetical protein